MLYKIIIVGLLLVLTDPSKGAELITCQSTEDCKCPDQTKIAIKENFHIDRAEFKIIARCLEFMKDVKLSISPTPEVNCVELKTPPNLYQTALNVFPPGCGYEWKRFKVSEYRRNIASMLSKKSVLCGKDYHAMCTSAVFLALVAEFKRRHEVGLLSKEKLLEWSDLKGPIWKMLNDQARPDLMMQELGIGMGKVLRKDQFDDKDWPIEGDVVQLWRNDNSGHSVIFAGKVMAKDSKLAALCYWSANLGTNGYGKRCEPIKNFDRMIVGRLVL